MNEPSYIIIKNQFAFLLNYSTKLVRQDAKVSLHPVLVKNKMEIKETYPSASIMVWEDSRLSNDKKGIVNKFENENIHELIKIYIASAPVDAMFFGIDKRLQELPKIILSENQVKFLHDIGANVWTDGAHHLPELDFFKQTLGSRSLIEKQNPTKCR